MSIFKKRLKREEDENSDELEKILTEIKNEEEKGAVVVKIEITGLKELVAAIHQLTEALKKCS